MKRRGTRRRRPSFEDTNNRASVKGLTDHYSSMPQIRAAVERAGIDVREFTLVLVTLPQRELEAAG